jgi:hypothetical protein
MKRRQLALVALVTLSLSGKPAWGQDVSHYGERACHILDEMVRVIDGILARQARAILSSPTALFDGKTLGHWKRTDYAGGGEVRVEKDFRGQGPAIVVEAGATLSGVNWTEDLPKDNYEVSLEFMKIEGSDFACGLTFPAGDSHATLILGGWGGGVVGLSSLDGHDASENETTTYRSFPPNRWYRVRLRVALPLIEAWLDDDKVVSVDTTGKKISLRHGEISLSVPLGLSTYQTSAAFRNITLRLPGSSPNSR